MFRGLNNPKYVMVPVWGVNFFDGGSTIYTQSHYNGNIVSRRSSLITIGQNYNNITDGHNYINIDKGYNYNNIGSDSNLYAVSPVIHEDPYSYVTYSGYDGPTTFGGSRNGRLIHTINDGVNARRGSIVVIDSGAGGGGGGGSSRGGGDGVVAVIGDSRAESVALRGLWNNNHNHHHHNNNNNGGSISRGEHDVVVVEGGGSSHVSADGAVAINGGRSSHGGHDVVVVGGGGSSQNGHELAAAAGSGRHSLGYVNGVGAEDTSAVVANGEGLGYSNVDDGETLGLGHEFRYGIRDRVSPFYRDLPYWRRLHPDYVHHRPLPNSDRSAMNNYVTIEVPSRRKVLTIRGVDLHIAANTREHRTNEYHCTERKVDPRLVVRRGDVFVMTFTFQRPWSSQHDDMYLRFSLGETSREDKGSLVTFQVSERHTELVREHGAWRAKIHSQSGNSLSIYVYMAPNAIIGEWTCTVTTALAGTNDTFVYDGVGEIYVLFNPWRHVDQVHYPDNQKDLDEYILNEYGCVFAGQTEHISQSPWFYGQFQDGILDICMTILRMAFEMEVTPEMGDAITVTRKLSRILNHQDRDSGILIGNWSGNYRDGTAPSLWRGSVQILKQYARTQEPVGYAQCWVFSHVFTTICRALGIPCRSLTNFASAHDTDKTVTIDYYKDEEGHELPEFTRDSIWNFHSWNDVWINRPELDSYSPTGARYSGWHAVDGTPQERSQGRFQCGPCPLTAIKNGELQVGFDTNFIFGEVNGEVCTWMVPADGSRNLKLISKDPSRVGKRISTKVPDGLPASQSTHYSKRFDITNDYKYPEGSVQERMAVRQAIGRDLGDKLFETPGGVSLELLHPPGVHLGHDFVVVAIVLNRSSEGRRMDLSMGVSATDYTGRSLAGGMVAGWRREGVVLSPGEKKQLELPVPARSYLKQCDQSMSMTLHTSARIHGHDKPVVREEKFAIHIPELEVQIHNDPNRLEPDQQFTVSVSATNPSEMVLTGCFLQLTGTIHPVSTSDFTEKDGAYAMKLSNIGPHRQIKLTFEVKCQEQPLVNRARELEVGLASDQLPNLSGSLSVLVL